MPERNIVMQEDGSVSVADMAALMQVTPVTVRNWIDKGCPVTRPGGRGRGGSARLRVSHVLLWRIEQEISPDAGGDYNFDQAKAKEMHFRGIKREVEAYETIKALIPVDAITEVINREYGEVKAGLVAIPARVSVRLAACEDPTEVSAILREEIDGVMRALSEPDEITRAAGGDPTRSVLEDLDPAPDDDEDRNDEGERNSDEDGED